MSRESLGLSPGLQEYLLSVSLREDPVARELREYTAGRSDANMQIAPEQGQFMALLVKLMGAQRILEIGTFTGYSALLMARSLTDDGHLITLDVNSDTARTAEKFWKKAGVSHRIESVIGPARESLKNLSPPFDLVFIDADKTNYDHYYESALELLRPGGAILIDNVLWDGNVIDERVQDADTRAIRELNQKIQGDKRVEISLLPLADGLTLCRKKESSGENT